MGLIIIDYLWIRVVKGDEVGFWIVEIFLGYDDDDEYEVVEIVLSGIYFFLI